MNGRNQNVTTENNSRKNKYSTGGILGRGTKKTAKGRREKKMVSRERKKERKKERSNY